MNRTEIKERVKTYLEELTPEWLNNLQQTDGVDIDSYLDNILLPQLNELLLNAPVKLLPLQEVKDDVTIKMNIDGTGCVVMPTHLIRPAMLKMRGWNMSVTNFIDETHPLYELQFNAYTRGTPHAPVAVWRAGENGVSIIEYFSVGESNPTHSIDTLLCVVAHTDPENFDLHPLLLDALCYRCASAFYAISGNSAMADVMKARAVV